MKVLLFGNTDWYLYNFRLSLAKALRDQGHEVLLLSPPGPYGERLRELGFQWSAAPMVRRSLNPFRELALVLWLRKYLRTQSIDLIHNFTIKCAVYGSLAARLAGTPACINAVAGMGYVFTNDSPKARILRPIVRTLFRIALNSPRSRLILQNADDVAIFEQSKTVRAEYIRLIRGSGVDCTRFFPGAKDNTNLQFRVVLAARLLWDKGVREYVEAAEMLLKQGRAIEFLLAGDPDPGNPAAVPQEDLANWEKQGWIRWLGHVDDMPALYRSVDIVVLPSYREGLPKGLIEAAATGAALITTDAPGCREVVTNEEDGLLVPVKDATALAASIARLQDDVALRNRLGRAAREKALSQFDEKLIVRQTLKVYRELIHAEA